MNFNGAMSEELRSVVANQWKEREMFPSRMLG